MPRTARASVGGICHHVINRANARREVFPKDGDYHAFLKAMAYASVEVPMRVLGFCLLPNHFHLAAWPIEEGDLSRWMHWSQYPRASLSQACKTSRSAAIHRYAM